MGEGFGRSVDAIQSIIGGVALDPPPLSAIDGWPTHEGIELLVLRCLVCDALVRFSSTYDAPEIIEPLRLMKAIAAALTSHSPVDVLRQFAVAASRDHIDALMIDVRRFVDSHLSAKLTLQRLAQQFGVSARTLNARFKSAFQVCVHDYITVGRVGRGLAMLADGHKVEVVALSVGYRSKKDFYRAVRQYTGLTPSRLRKARSVG